MKPNDFMQFAQKLWPLNRSLTGRGVVQTLQLIKEIIPELSIKHVKSGTIFLDWEAPKEWNITHAYIIDPSGNKICDYSENNLSLVGYSIPILGTYTLDELQKHLFSLPEQPDAIPYVTSYYKEFWGFCISQNLRNKLVEGIYQVVINGTLQNGQMHFGELVVPGSSKKEILISTYICHPSMANDQISGIVVSTFLAKWISENTDIKVVLNGDGADECQMGYLYNYYSPSHNNNNNNY
jgi:aminopeptidase-like protein